MVNVHEAQRANLTAGMTTLWVGKLMCEGTEWRNIHLTSKTALLSPIEEDSLRESDCMGYYEDELENASSMLIDTCLTPVPHSEHECLKGSKVKRPVCKTAARNHSRKQLSTQGYNRMAHAMISEVNAIKMQSRCFVIIGKHNTGRIHIADPSS